MNHIVLVANMFRDAGFVKARRIYDLLSEAGHEVFVGFSAILK